MCWTRGGADPFGSIHYTASVVSSSRNYKEAQYYLELSRLDRTLAKMSALTEVCQQNMQRANMLCEQFESKPAPK